MVDMLKEMLIRLLTVTFVLRMGEALLPEGSVSDTARRLFGAAGLTVILTPLIGSLYGA